MGRKATRRPKSGETAPVAFRLDAKLVAAIDAERKRLEAIHHQPISRTFVIREWLNAMADRARGKK
jgi:hypothetical protein